MEVVSPWNKSALTQCTKKVNGQFQPYLPELSWCWMEVPFLSHSAKGGDADYVVHPSSTHMNGPVDGVLFQRIFCIDFLLLSVRSSSYQSIHVKNKHNMCAKSGLDWNKHHCCCWWIQWSCLASSSSSPSLLLSGRVGREWTFNR